MAFLQAEMSRATLGVQEFQDQGSGLGVWQFSTRVFTVLSQIPRS